MKNIYLFLILVIGLMPEKLPWSFFNRKAALMLFFSVILSSNSFELFHSGIVIYNSLWQIILMNILTLYGYFSSNCLFFNFGSNTWFLYDYFNYYYLFVPLTINKKKYFYESRAYSTTPQSNKRTPLQSIIIGLKHG